MQLKDQVALVTGGSRGIGRAIVKSLASEGATVAFVYRGNQQAADELTKEITDAGGKAKAFQADVADRDASDACCKAVIDEFERVDVLVNNAGVIKDGLFIQMNPENWDLVVNTNLGGVFNFCRAIAYQMVRQRGGRIINVSSVAADHVNRGQTNYSASKGAVNSFTRALAVELAKRNITVNAVAPGFIDTDMSEAVRNAAGDFIEKKLIPMQRLGKPEDIAAAVLFLASPAAAYLTGQVITVDGGLSLGAASP